MRQSEFSLLYAYLYNNQLELEQEVKQMQTNIRYRRIDETDCFELACAIERLNTFKQVSEDIRSMLSIFDKKCKKENKK